ncbi:hypothetical protein [Coxiella endosymbiont of Ornithodoros amblus]|uniref:hypothetical protein n=1 Tax=Coxiella endosymbiont of Ornithodoros amblus TaxID=1656166 RepID=UPI00244E20CB|nr:hypothetical protein [Coxiella endosymbiont of Ornithodoros amblus]
MVFLAGIRSIGGGRRELSPALANRCIHLQTQPLNNQRDIERLLKNFVSRKGKVYSDDFPFLQLSALSNCEARQ